MERGALTVVAVAVVLTASVDCGTQTTGEAVTQVQSAVTTSFALPVVVGLSPNDVALGATGAVAVNDLASISANPGADTSIVALGSINIGYNANVGKIWTQGIVLLRHSNLAFYKTFLDPISVQIQAGTTFTDPDENRTNVPVRPDPIWTVSITAPSSGLPQSVFSGQTLSLAPGDGRQTVFSGGTLRLSTGGEYGFVTLDLEPGATAQVVAPATTTISVTSALILRAPLGGAGMVFAYLGSQAAHVEAPFVGDLFLAPNADVEIKRSSTGHFFAKNITVFEAMRVTAPALSARSRQIVRPTEFVRTLGNGQFHPSAIQGEIATAIITPSMNAACAQPTAFMSRSGSQLLFRTLNSIGSSPLTAAALPTMPDPLPAPPFCTGSQFPDRPPPPWTILPGGRPFYRDGAEPNDIWDQGAATDNLMVRLDGGRALFVGFSERHCEDPSTGQPQGPGCPGTQPSTGSPCDAVVTTGACIYGATPGTQCTCPVTCTLGGVACTSNAQCCTGVCSPGSNTARPHRRPRACSPVVALSVKKRESLACACRPIAGRLGQPESWNQPRTLSPTSLDRDRPEAYFDPFDRKLYVSERTNLPDPQANTVFSAFTNGITDARNFLFSVVRTTTNDLGFPMVMTTGTR